VDENKQEPKGACFGKQKFDFESNTHARHQRITPNASNRKCLKLHKTEQWRVRLSATRLSGGK